MGTNASPNILFVSLTSSGARPWATLAGAGHYADLDAFAASGIRFTRAVANAPVCCAMRASMLTGLHPLSHGVVTNDVQLREDVPGVAKSLAAAGYRTGTSANGIGRPDRGCFTRRGAAAGLRLLGHRQLQPQLLRRFYYRDSPEPIWFDGYEPTGQTDLAIDYLRGASQDDNPFFLFLSWGRRTARTSMVPDRFKRMYDPESLTLRPNVRHPEPRDNRRLLRPHHRARLELREVDGSAG